MANGALDVTFVESAEHMTILLVRTKGVPLTLVGFRPEHGHPRPGGRRPGIQPYTFAAARRIPHQE
jgi:hypothetical protein